jgi:hypothetical protein
MSIESELVQQPDQVNDLHQQIQKQQFQLA